MLNELRDLARSLSGAGIIQEDWHSNFKPCTKSPAFRVYLTLDGQTEKIEPADDGVSGIRKWEANNGESFPTFNIPPLYEATRDTAKAKIAVIKKKLKGNEAVSEVEIDEAIAECAPWNVKVERNIKKKVENSCRRTAGEVKKMLGNVPAEYGAILDLIGRSEKIEFVDLRDAIRKFAVAGLSGGRAEFTDLLLKSKWQSLQLIIEFAGSAYEYPPNHNATQAWMNKKFLEHDQNTLVAVTSKDAFGEDATGANKQKYPEVKLPVLGQVKLRSMFKDIPAQTRYGMIEANSFPAGDKVRKEMKSALEWLCKTERKGKTWCDLTRKMDKSSLLFAYPAEMPDTPPEMAGLLGGVDKDPDGVLFSALTERVVKALKGIAKDRPDSDIRIFVLAKMDTARTKVLVSRRYTARHMIDSAEEWQKGYKNIPAIRVRQFGKEKGNTLWAEPLEPSPTELLWCLNTAWLRQGTYAKAVYGYSMNDALSLLLDTGPEMRRLTLRAIDTIVRNSSSLILSIVQENYFARVFKINGEYAKQPLLLPSIMGLLLYKSGMKGGYMDSHAFLVGRFMSFADKLHLKYCEHVRKNSIPPQLVGNALMSTALETPVKALSILSQRILPYQAWANTLKNGDDVGLVKYFLGQLGEVSDKLKDLDIPSQCTDAEKAQMLLGYLSRSEKTND